MRRLRGLYSTQWVKEKCGKDYKAHNCVSWEVNRKRDKGKTSVGTNVNGNRSRKRQIPDKYAILSLLFVKLLLFLVV